MERENLDELNLDLFQTMSEMPSKKLTEEEKNSFKLKLKEKFDEKQLKSLGIHEPSNMHQYLTDFCFFYKEITTNEDFSREIPNNLR